MFLFKALQGGVGANECVLFDILEQFFISFITPITMILKWWQLLISYNHITPMLLPEHNTNYKLQNIYSICLRTHVNYSYYPMGTSYAILHSILTLTTCSKHRLHRLRAQQDCSYFRCQPQIWGPQATFTSDQLATNLERGFSMNPLD